MQNNEIWDGEEFSSLVVIPPELDGTRADAALSKLTDQSRSAIERLIDGGQIFRGETPEKGKPLSKKDKVIGIEVYGKQNHKYSNNPLNCHGIICHATI